MTWAVIGVLGYAVFLFMFAHLWMWFWEGTKEPKPETKFKPAGLHRPR